MATQAPIPAPTDVVLRSDLGEGRPSSMTRSTIGDAPKRREDARFTTGHGAYLDDLPFADLAHAVVLRSVHAHAGIAGIDVAAARQAPGVRAVLTAADVAADGLQALRPHVEANVQ